MGWTRIIPQEISAENVSQWRKSEASSKFVPTRDPEPFLSPRTDDITSSDTRTEGEGPPRTAAECENVISREADAAAAAAAASIPEKQFAIKWENVGRS